MSSRLIVVANLLRRGAALRYARLLGLSSVEFGILAMLGERVPTPVRDLAALLGMDKAQLSRGLSALAKRHLISRKPGVFDQRDVLVALTARGLEAHRTIIASAELVNERLVGDVAGASLDGFVQLLDTIEARASALLEEESELSRAAGSGAADAGDQSVKPSVRTARARPAGSAAGAGPAARRRG